MQSDEFSHGEPAAGARAAGTSASWAAPSGRSSRPPRRERRLGPGDAGALRRLHAGRPYTPSAAFLGREKQKLSRHGQRARAGRARRRRDRRHARRHAHARRDPRPRRRRLRGRRDRHRHAGRPPPERGLRGRHPVLRRASRSACRACRRSSRRSPRAATTSSTSARRGPPASIAAMTARVLESRSSARTTRSWRPTRACAPATRRSSWP